MIHAARRDFYCQRQIIVKEMLYFKKYLQDKRPDELVEIDVYCDVEVFEWLMDYICKRKVTLEARTVVSVLISSNFLQMGELERQCLTFIHANVNHIVQGVLFCAVIFLNII